MHLRIPGFGRLRPRREGVFEPLDCLRYTGVAGCVAFVHQGELALVRAFSPDIAQEALHGHVVDVLDDHS